MNYQSKKFAEFVGRDYEMATFQLKSKFGEEQVVDGETERVIDEVPESGTEEYEQLDEAYQKAIDLRESAHAFLRQRHKIVEFLEEDASWSDQSRREKGIDNLTEMEQDKFEIMDQRVEGYGVHVDKFRSGLADEGYKV